MGCYTWVKWSLLAVLKVSHYTAVRSGPLHCCQCQMWAVTLPSESGPSGVGSYTVVRSRPLHCCQCQKWAVTLLSEMGSLFSSHVKLAVPTWLSLLLSPARRSPLLVVLSPPVHLLEKWRHGTQGVGSM